MSTEFLFPILSIAIVVLGIACFLLASERDHWKREYESLRNAMLAAGAQSKRGMTVDEFIDAQG